SGRPRLPTRRRNTLRCCARKLSSGKRRWSPSAWPRSDRTKKQPDRRCGRIIRRKTPMRTSETTAGKPASSFVPVIDIAPCFHGSDTEKRNVARQIDKASREVGFYVIVGHGVAPDLVPEMEAISRAFFEQPLDDKMKLHVSAHSSSVGYAAVG